MSETYIWGLITEPYVKLKFKRGQSLCAQLRAGALPLTVEVGRYKGVSEEQLCFGEDEILFLLLYCPLYNHMRNSMLQRIQCKNPELFWLFDGNMLS